MLKASELNYVEYDLFGQNFLKNISFVRCMNVLNANSWFSDQQIIIGVSNLKSSLIEGGILLIGRTDDVSSQNNASFFKKINGKLIHLEDFNLGSGSIKEDLTNLALRLCVEERISFVDWAEPELFASYIHSCDIFVAPARFDNFPTTVIAAMQAGKAVVATDKVGSAVEFIETDINGLIVPSDDPIAMAKALKQLIENTDMRVRMATAGQKTMREWPVERGVQLIVRASKEALDLCAAS